jgi:hypothetical protein
MAKKQRVSRTGNIVKVEYPTLRKQIEVDITKLSPEIQFLGLAHGIGQKLGDAASGGTPQEKFEMATRIIENLRDGNWELTSQGDNGAEVIAAVSRIKKIKPDVIEKSLSALTDEKRDEKLKEWRSNPKVKAEIAAERARRAAEAAEEDDTDLDLE